MLARLKVFFRRSATHHYIKNHNTFYSTMRVSSREEKTRVVCENQSYDLDEKLLCATTHRDVVFCLFPGNAVHAYGSNMKKEYVLRALDQVCYINCGYGHVDMATKMIAVDAAWNMYMYGMLFTKEPHTTNYSTFHLVSRKKLIHVYQRESFWYVFSIGNSSETVLDVYFPNVTLFYTLTVTDEQCVDVILDGAIAILLTFSTIGYYDIITRKLSWFVDEENALSPHHFSFMWKTEDNKLHVIDNHSISTVEEQSGNRITFKIENTQPVDYVCDSRFDIKSNTSDYNYPFVSCFSISDNYDLLYEERHVFEVLKSNTSKKIVVKNPVRLTHHMPYNQLPGKKEVILPNLTGATSLYSLFSCDFVISMDEFEKTEYFHICESPQCRKFIEFVTSNDTFGSSWLLYRHPISNGINCVPDNSNWLKVFATNHSFNVPISFITQASTRLSLIVSMKD